jgi:FKBP-type peptidyl-prolyl cis-trans isomerase
MIFIVRSANLELTARSLAFVAALLALGTIVGCGSTDSSSTATTHASQRRQAANPVERPRSAMSKTEVARLSDLVIHAASAPAPERLVVRDIHKGTGAAVERGDRIRVDFIGVRYGEGLKAHRGADYRPTEFGYDEVMKGWKKGLVGMRVGGRRELVVPTRLGDSGTTAVYLIDLLAIRSG